MPALLFDLFHTLVDVASAPGNQGRYTADILGIDRAAWRAACFSEHHDICGSTRGEEVIRTLAHAIDPGIADVLIQEAAEERRHRFAHALRSVEPEVLATLARLRAAGWRLGLISNASTDEVAAWSDSPLAPLFRASLFSCRCGLKKPDPAIYRLALEQLACSAEQAIFIGDGGSDEHRGARSVGLTTVLLRHFTNGSLPSEVLAARRVWADMEVGRFGQLPQALATWGSDKGRGSGASISARSPSAPSRV